MRLPRQRIWPILPGDRSFLNCSERLSWGFLAGRTRVEIPLRECPSQASVCRPVIVREQVGGTDYCAVGDEEVANDQD